MSKVLTSIYLALFLVLISFNGYAQEADSEIEITDSSETTPVEGDYEAMDDSEFDKILNPKKAEEEAKPQRIVFAIKAIDASTKAPIPAYIELKALTSNGKIFKGEGFCNNKGIFKLDLVADAKVKVQISYGTYMPVTDMFNIKDIVESKGKEQVKKLYKLELIPEDEYINLDKITFEQGQSKLDKQSYSQLDELALILAANPEMEIEIAGHTDDTGSKSASQKLSEERVETVKNYLVEKKNIDDKRIKEVGYGSSRPIAKGTDATSREQNRRVEFKILKM